MNDKLPCQIAGCNKAFKPSPQGQAQYRIHLRKIHNLPNQTAPLPRSDTPRSDTPRSDMPNPGIAPSNADIVRKQFNAFAHGQTPANVTSLLTLRLMGPLFRAGTPSLTSVTLLSPDKRVVEYAQDIAKLTVFDDAAYDFDLLYTQLLSQLSIGDLFTKPDIDPAALSGILTTLTSIDTADRAGLSAAYRDWIVSAGGCATATPHWVAQLVVSMCKLVLKDDAGGDIPMSGDTPTCGDTYVSSDTPVSVLRVFDPFCGVGDLLIAAHDVYPTAQLRGCSPNYAQATCALLAHTGQLHQIEKCASGAKGATVSTHDMILTSLSHTHEHRADALLACMRALADDGVCAIVLPAKDMASVAPQWIAARAELCKIATVHVVRLPKNTMAIGAENVLLVFKRIAVGAATPGANALGVNAHVKFWRASKLQPAAPVREIPRAQIETNNHALCVDAYVQVPAATRDHMQKIDAVNEQLASVHEQTKQLLSLLNAVSDAGSDPTVHEKIISQYKYVLYMIADLHAALWQAMPA